MLHPDYPAWSAVGMIMIILPLPWHWRAKNLATLALIFWIFCNNLMVFVNTLVWADNFRDVAPGWCDISGRGLLVVPFAVSMCSALQMRRLESVASTRRSVISASERTRRMWVEGSLGFGFPFLLLPPLWVVQGHRYDIVESIGCAIPTYYAWPGIILRYFVPMVISLVSITYACLSIRWFIVRRMQFRAILAASNSGLNISRYLRLIALAVVLNVVVLANDLLSTIITLTTRIEPYRSFGRVHSSFGAISYYPEALQPLKAYPVTVLQIYIGPIYAIIFFIFFGLSEEAIGEYVAVAVKMRTALARLGLVADKPKPKEEVSLPNLGSRVFPSAGAEWKTLQGRSMSDEEREEKLFDANVNAPESQSGIPVTVERSVV